MPTHPGPAAVHLVSCALLQRHRQYRCFHPGKCPVEDRPFQGTLFGLSWIVDEGQCHHVDLAFSLGRELPSTLCLRGLWSTLRTLAARLTWTWLLIPPPRVFPTFFRPVVDWLDRRVRFWRSKSALCLCQKTKFLSYPRAGRCLGHFVCAARLSLGTRRSFLWLLLPG